MSKSGVVVYNAAMGRLSSMPATLKPQERLFMVGADGLSLTELIALVIRSGSSQSDVLDTSTMVLDCLMTGQVSLSSLSSIKGVGRCKACALMAALHLSSRLESVMSSKNFCDPQYVAKACTDIAMLPQEHLVVFYLTSRSGLLQRETVFIGTLDASLIHPREVFRSAIMHNASHIIIAHNHPSGDPTPSSADIESTRMLARAGQCVGILLTDHLIVTKSSFVSLRQQKPVLFDSQ